MDRRKFLAGLGLAPLWPATGQRFRLSPPSDAEIRGFDFSTLAGPVTPNDQFYIRNHFPVPALVEHDWRLEIFGQVQTPLVIQHREMMLLPAKSLTVTVECAGNGVGEGGVSNANWTGISLKELLKRAGLLQGVKHIRLTGADKGSVDSPTITIPYGRSIPIDKALHPDTLLAYRMNGSPLSHEHGYPLRAIIPGWYGMDSVKWLVKIEALTRPDTSYFMTRAYVSSRLQTIGTEEKPIDRMRVKSQIASPRDGEVIPRGPYVVRGAAWAGENRVAKVEVSTDGGDAWVDASLDGEPRPYAWTLWNYHWEAGTPGFSTLLARARDDQGTTQPESRDALRLDPYEQNTYHSVRCQVEPG